MVMLALLLQPKIQSSVLLLSDMVGPDEVDGELENDVASECAVNGKVCSVCVCVPAQVLAMLLTPPWSHAYIQVEKVYIHKTEANGQAAVKIFVKFADVAGAHKVCRAGVECGNSTDSAHRTTCVLRVITGSRTSRSSVLWWACCQGYTVP